MTYIYKVRPDRSWSHLLKIGKSWLKINDHLERSYIDRAQGIPSRSIHVLPVALVYAPEYSSTKSVKTKSGVEVDHRGSALPIGPHTDA